MMIFVKFKPAYSVTLGDEEIGFVENRTELQSIIDNDVLTTDDESVDRSAFSRLRWF